MKVTSETIRETSRGWLNKHTGRYHKTASSAYRAAIHRNKVRAQVGMSALVLTWEPTTAIGSAIAKSFQK